MSVPQMPPLPPVRQIAKGALNIFAAIFTLLLAGVIVMGSTTFMSALVIHALIEIFQFGWGLIPDL